MADQTEARKLSPEHIQRWREDADVLLLAITGRVVDYMVRTFDERGEKMTADDMVVLHYFIPLVAIETRAALHEAGYLIESAPTVDLADTRIPSHAEQARAAGWGPEVTT